MIARNRSGRSRGQMVVLLAISVTALILMVGLVLDGGNALSQRRASQNASDFAALAGARVVAEWVGGNTTDGTDAYVKTAIMDAIAANGGSPIAFGALNGPRYVDAGGALLGYVGDGTIPAGSVGVRVSSTRSWTPYFLGLVGINNWSASAEATARGGFAAGGPPGNVFPIGLADAFLETYPVCSGPVSNDPTDPCYPQHLTPGNLNVPGGFGWLKFGATGKCTGFGLGMDPNNGCDESKPFLQSEIGPPANSFGCCTAVTGGAAPADQIGSLDGNKVSADCSYYIDNKVTVTVPVWDTAGGVGSSGFYHIIGFSGFQLTGCTGGKDIEGVLRQPLWQGPTTSTPPPFPGAALAVQLVH